MHYCAELLRFLAQITPVNCDAFIIRRYVTPSNGTLSVFQGGGEEWRCRLLRTAFPFKKFHVAPIYVSRRERMTHL